MAIKFSRYDEFIEWLKTKYYPHTITQTGAYFKKHLSQRSFRSPQELNRYILSKKRGIKNLIVAARVYLNFCEYHEYMTEEAINYYRKYLKIPRGHKDIYVPSNDEIIKNFEIIKSHKSLRMVYIVLACSGIRYVEALDFLGNYDPKRFRVHSNYVSYSVGLLRNTKNINNIYLPKFVYEILHPVTNTYQSLAVKVKEKGASVTFKYLRKWNYNFLLYNQVPESVADWIQGRSGKSVSANHYLAKGQQADYWYEKVADKFHELFKTVQNREG
ncbi:hypothetical protein JW968_05235 [Candidatus Woesearchaeota archaeon]|nr:hypothetical protein [Candidatus Woesearchaeota archaeon]